MKTKMLALLFLAVPAFAAGPRIVNGRVGTAASLSQIPANGWAGYAITANRSFSSCGCRLDSDGDNLSGGERTPSPAVVFVRMRDGQPARVKFFSTNCDIDANGETVAWIDSVSNAESIAYLRHVIESGPDHARNGALFALSMESGSDDALIDIARNNPSSHLRGQALFWLSQEAGAKAAAALRDAVDNDPEESVRAKAVFGISQLPNDESIPLLVDLMKHNRSREVRKKAAFWLGQKNDPRALQAIEDVLRQ
jgi:HEAT repeat protein